MMIMMKTSFFFFAALSVPAATYAKPGSSSSSLASVATKKSSRSQKSSLGPKPGHAPNASYSPQDVLESSECEPFLMEIEKKISELLEYDDSTIANQMCNPIQRETLVTVTGEMEKKVKNNQNTDPCLQAYEMLLLEHQYELMEALVSEETCNSEMQKELKTLREVNDDRRRGALRGRNLVSEHEVKQFIAVFGVTAAIIIFGFVVVASVLFHLSDIRLKEDIEQVGVSPSGIPMYTFKYRSDLDDLVNATILDVDTTSTYFGAMAQDLLNLAPDAVILNPTNGYYAVDYSKIDVDFHKID